MKTILIIALAIAGTLAAPQTLHHGRIMGGHNAKLGQYPYQVSYQFAIDNLRQHYCGGIVLSPTWILTTGSCTDIVPPFGHIVVVAGTTDLSKGAAQEIVVINRISHPKYTGLPTSPYDIGLARLAKPLEFNEFVQPIKLPKAGTVLSGDAVLTGWGALNETGVSYWPDVLQAADVTIIDGKSCKGKFEDLGYNAVINEKLNVCTVSKSDEDVHACMEDSGDALVQDGVLVGVLGMPTTTPCGVLKNAPSIYVSATNDEVVDFILSNVIF